MAQTILILGGLGQDGSRHMISFLLNGSSQPASDSSTRPRPTFVRIVDKFLIIPQADPMPSTVYLDARTKAALKTGQAEYLQGNLLTEGKERAFWLPDAHGGSGRGFDVVLDFTGEADFDLSDAVHIERTLKLALGLGNTAAATKVGAYIRVLPSQYKTNKSKVGEQDSGPAEPWGVRARWHQEAARALAAIPNLNLVCVRPAYFYGPATLTGVSPRALIGELYRFRNEKLEFLWKESLAVNTIHTEDFCAAVLAVIDLALERDREALLALAGETLVPGLDDDKPIRNIPGALRPTEKVDAPVFEVVDDGETTQGDLATLISQVIGVQCGFHHSVISSFAKMNIQDVLEDVNEKHMQGWSDLLTASNPPVSPTTPLSPYTPVDLLQPYPLTFSSRKLKQIGWKPQHRLDAKSLHDTIKGFKAEGIWPSAKSR
ncbi:hypothetical protein OIV83_001639 [Microbotryomycetes sp. JL201]|nr:hypothetical protein OIV83_001639 [Microbotryomycetes sp. JL201]